MTASSQAGTDRILPRPGRGATASAPSGRSGTRARTRALAALSPLAASAALAAAFVENFEAPTVPQGWGADAGGEIGLAPERFKSGRQSLRWRWTRPGAVLTGAVRPGPAPLSSNQCLALWLYNETPREQILRVELVQGSDVVGRCWYVLNFRGWRPLGAPYGQVLDDLERSPDGLRLIAPAGAAGGRLYVDWVNARCADKLRPDHQQPWVGRPDVLKTPAPEKFVYSSADLSFNRPWLPGLVPADRITEEERESLAAIRDRHPLPLGCLPRKDPTVLEDFRNICGIRRSPDGVLTGRPVVPPRDGFNGPPDGILLYDRLNPPRKWTKPNEESPVGDVLQDRLAATTHRPPGAKPPGGDIRHATAPGPVGTSPAGVPMLQRLAEACAHESRARNADEAERLKQAFFDLCDHLLDQGFAEGNANAHVWCFPTAPLIGMRRELQESGRLRDMMLACMAFGTSYSDGVLTAEDFRTADIFGSPRNTDGFGNYHELLRFIVLLPDASERLQRLYAYRRVINLLCDPQLGEPYAWDGTCHHHMMFHPGYSAGALVPQALTLRGTCFEPAPEALATLKRSILMLAFMSDARGIMPANCPGYTGVPLGIWSRPETLGQFAAMLSNGSRVGVDPDLAGVYLAFHADNPNPPEMAREFKERGLAPVTPAGHRSVNGASIALHRRDHWLVAIAGKYRFRRGLEPNYTGSLFNHYARNGSVFVVSGGNPVSTWASGYSLEGWDARHYPGTTHYLGESEKDLLCRSRGHSENVLAGGTELDGDGIWGMNSPGQTDPRLARAGNITFNKSAFCFGNRITLLTTGIGRCALADEQERALELATTLWQNAFGSGGQVGRQNLRLGFNTPPKPPPVPPAREPCWVNDERIERFPWEVTLPPGPAHRLVDNKGTGYYIHPGSPPVRLARRHQAWTFPSAYLLSDRPVNRDPSDLRNFRPTEGDFCVAWFDHGVAPDRPECAYTLIPASTPESIGQFAKGMADDDPPYRVLEKSARAHVVRDRDSRTTGYVVFDPSWRSPSTMLQSVNRPCTVMVKETEGGLRISAATTDMDSWLREILVSGDIVLTLSGEWDLPDAEVPVTRRNGGTTLSIPYRTFMPAVLTLAPPATRRPAVPRSR